MLALRIKSIRVCRCFGKKLVALFVVFSLLVSQFTVYFSPAVYAATSPWSQTDWSGGSGQTSWSDDTKFDSSSSVTTSTAGQVTMTKQEKLSNTGFETDLSSWTEVPSYVLNDQFTTDRAAGAVNGTSAEPTGGTRTVVDTGSNLSISGSQLNIAGGAGSWANPGLWYSSITRSAGKTMIVKTNISDIPANNGNSIGFSTAQSGVATPSLFRSGSNIRWLESGLEQTVGTFSISTDYQIAQVLRSSGSYYYIKGGVYTNWTLLWISTQNSTATLYPAISNNAGASTADNIRIPTATWLPTPLAYDTFTRGDGAIGSSETTGPDSQTTPSLAWTGGAISTNKNVITPTLGSELVVNGGFDTDTGWTKGTGWTIDTADSNVAIATNSSGVIYQGTTAVIGTWNSMTWTVASRTSGSFYAYVGTSHSSNLRSSAGTYVETGRNISGTGNMGSV